MERNPSLIVARLNHNASFFYMNYIVVFTVLFCLTMITSPSAIIGMAFLGLGWAAMFRYTAEGSATVYGITISQKHASIVMGVITGLLLIKILSHVFWWTLFSGGFLCGAHAFMRDASMHKDMEDIVEMTGDVSFNDAGEDASFLNPQSNEAV